MYLCFGTLGTLLVHGKIDQITNKTPFIAKLILTIDPDSIYANRSSDTDDTFGNHFGSESGISRLLSCATPFVAFDKNQVKITSLDEVKKNISSMFLPFVDEYKKANIICSLLEIIRNDETLKNENQYLFKNIFGTNSEAFLLHTKYDFCDLIAKALLYVTNIKIDNKRGATYVKLIDDNWIKTNRSYYMDKFKWDDSRQCLTFSLLSYFNKMIRSYKIDVFIEKVDPTGCFEYLWIEKCDAFLEKVSDTLDTYASPFYESNKSNVDNIFKFLNKLEEYTYYIGQNVTPLYKNEEEINDIDIDAFYQQLILYEEEHPGESKIDDIYEFMAKENFDDLSSQKKSRPNASPKKLSPSINDMIVDDLKNVGFVVPIHGEINIKCALAFASETQKYRNELVSIYRSINGIITPIRSRRST